MTEDTTPRLKSLPSLEVIARQDTIKRLLWGDKVEGYMRQFDWQQLFTTALRNRIAAINVAKFISKAVDEVFLSRVLDIEERVSAHRLNPSHERDHNAFALVFRRLMQPTARELSLEDKNLRRDLLQYMVTHMLSQFELRYGDVKLMQAATGTFISGSFIAALIHRPFPLNDLDFFCGYDKSDNIVRYFKNQLDANFTVSSGDEQGYGSVHGVRKVITLTTPRGSIIHVIESYSDYPLELILNFHSAPTRGVLSSDGFSHFEVHRARNGLALVTPKTLCITPDDVDSQNAAWHIIHKYMRRGVTFIFEYNVPHECGKHLECPATLRNTSADGCLHIDLPTVDVPDFSLSPKPTFVWSLGPVGMCSTGRVNGSQVIHTHSFCTSVGPANTCELTLSIEYLVFRKLVSALMQMHTVPEGLIRVYPWSDYWSADGFDDSDSD
ncbi:hypothetical protein R3P38DRAFT_1730601 [Favolaschia claudopus]|uniref:Uncharacterized protein n=1 Tax=Favolaschia claudopus TaxID=2862362 RepID=A0AAW0A982_9AGAR